MPALARQPFRSTSDSREIVLRCGSVPVISFAAIPARVAREILLRSWTNFFPDRLNPSSPRA